MLYKGFDVMPWNPSRDKDIDDKMRRSVVVMDSETGNETVVDRTVAPSPLRSYTIVCFDRAEIEELFAFLDARRGRAVPFWAPTFQADLTLRADVSGGASSIQVQWVGYTQDVYPMALSRRYLALYGPDAVLGLHMVTSATDNTTFETLGISPVAGRAYPADTVVSYLRLVRLEEDEVEISFPTPDTAIAVLQAREVPLEVPA